METVNITDEIMYIFYDDNVNDNVFAVRMKIDVKREESTEYSRSECSLTFINVLVMQFQSSFLSNELVFWTIHTAFECSISSSLSGPVVNVKSCDEALLLFFLNLIQQLVKSCSTPRPRTLPLTATQPQCCQICACVGERAVVRAPRLLPESGVSLQLSR